jgi:hypothetical protein
MVPVIRPRIVAAFVLVLGTCLGPGSDTVAHAGGDKHHHPVYVPGAFYVPATAMAPVAAPFAAAPVFVGAISTASAPTYYAAPANVSYGSAPVMVTAGTVTTANAPTVTTTTTANAPTAGTVYITNGTANAPIVANAPAASGLSQDQLYAILDELKELKLSLKDQGTSGTDRKGQVLERALKLVADEKGVAVEELKATDKLLARRLVDQAMGSTDSATGLAPSVGLAPQGSIQYQYQYAVPAQAAAPMQSYYLYPVPMVPVMPVKPCGHSHFCLCARAYP